MIMKWLAVTVLLILSLSGYALMAAYSVSRLGL